ncbi:MAG: hypothetical protein IJK04_09870 [Kiritimatiellae bacterium]|nr:hypothetical protein [Kiritimatiellia bacterium]
MTLSILLLVCAGLCSVIVGVAVGHVERRGYSLVRYQLLNCAVCVAVAVAGWAAAPSAMFPPSGCPPATWALVLAGTLLCGVFQYLMILMMGRAMKRGPNAIVWAIIQSGLIYPFLMGWLVFGSSMGPRRLVGIALILASVFLYAAGKARSGAIPNVTDPRKRVALRGWLPAALLGMLFCGASQCGANLPSFLEGGKSFSGTFRTLSIYSGLLLAALAHIAVRRVRGMRLAPAVRGEILDLALWAGATGVLTFLLCRYLKFPGLDRLESLGAGAMGYPVFVAACIAGYFPYGVIVLREHLDARQAAGFVLGISGILLGCL